MKKYYCRFSSEDKIKEWADRRYFVAYEKAFTEVRLTEKK